jgi:hypothetical protein
VEIQRQGGGWLATAGQVLRAGRLLTRVTGPKNWKIAKGE